VRRGAWAWAIGIAFVGCKPTARSAPSEAGALSLEAGVVPEVRLGEVENRRILGGVTEEDVGNHDVAVRRRAARALSRLGGTASLPPLFTALSDEDAEVVAWAAYGLGYVCRTETSSAGEIVKALSTRAATLPASESAALDPEFAVTRAIGRCATDEAEKVLETWLAGPRARASYAALALGDIASKKKALAQSTQLALLTAAASGLSTPALTEALHPFGRFDHPLSSAIDRLYEVAVARLGEDGPNRIFAIRALSRAGKGAATELGRVLARADSFTPAERAEAARGLGRLGDDGQRALGETLVSIAPARDALALGALGTSAFGPLLVALQTLAKPDLPGVKKLLYDLTTLAVPADAPVTLARRAVALRCRAASLLVNGLSDDPLLLRCDPEEGGIIGQRAQLEVLGRRPVRGKRLVQFRALASSPHARVREAAIELMGGHPEIEEGPGVIAAALDAKQAGIVATAAEFVVAHPDRIAVGKAKADVTTKLEEALGRAFAPDDVETVGALIEAAGAARLASAVPKLEPYCGHPNPTLREHAARALSLLKSTKTTCSVATALADPAQELGHLVSGEVKLELATDAGTLAITLDPSVAPVAVTRFADLARAGFYDGIVVHRVVPGFVAQFGDPGGDGFGGPGREPLRCETTPRPFDAMSVGVALAGRDTGSSQLFVTLARSPHLDGEYALVGKASGDWNAVAEGDVIRHVTVK
jgi:cyclophilin family peptidyl-prolyl cis-trans isomerase/HEAT repeat protein